MLTEHKANYHHWCQTVYQVRVHSSTCMTPEARFAQDSQQLRLLDPHQDLERLFYTKTDRVVRKDGTVRIENKLYEVQLSLRTLKVQLRYDPYRLDRIEVYFRDQPFGLARLADLQFNSQLDLRE